MNQGTEELLPELDIDHNSDPESADSEEDSLNDNLELENWDITDQFTETRSGKKYKKRKTARRRKRIFNL